MKGQKFLRLTHSILTVDEVDFAEKRMRVTGEYHIRLSSAEVGSGGAANQKAVGVGFLLPEGQVEIRTVSLNGSAVPAASPLNDLENVARFDLSYWSFPESANWDSMASVFSRVCENRRDLISYEEILKAHKTASLSQSFGMLVKIPPESVQQQSLTLVVEIQVTDSPLFKQLAFKDNQTFLATIGPEVWFPLPTRLMVLPSGSPVTAQPIEHQRHKITVRVPVSQIPYGMACIASGDKLPLSSDRLVFESSWLNPKNCGLFLGPFGPPLEEKSVFHAVTTKEFSDTLLPSTLRNELVSEIVQVLAPWFASPVQLLPQINLVFLPLPERRAFHVCGNTVVIDSSILHAEGAVERKLIARTVIAEAIASLWVERAMPAFAEPWLPVGIATMLADRFAEFHLGTNEYHYRVHLRRQKYHSLVERGLDWRPLSVIGEPRDQILELKAPLVIDCLRRSITGDSDLRAAFHEMATISGGKKGPWTSEMFLFLITCTVGQHTEAGQAVPAFKEEWIRSVGVPVIHVGFSMLEKRRFALSVSQRPLQKTLCHDFTPLCSTVGARANGPTHLCSCGQDFVSRSTEQQEGVISSFMRPHHAWPATVKRRFWNGPVQVSIFRASGYFIPVTVRMNVDAPSGSVEVLTVPYVTPRKHEMHLNRTLRDDELVHGFLAVTDDRWLLAKIIVCQSPLMWCNMLNFSRNVVLEQMAIEALQHVRGSTLVQEALGGCLLSKNTQYFWRTRIEAGRGLVHMAIGCGEREAMQAAIAWLKSYTVQISPGSEPSDILTWIGVGEYLATLKRGTDQRDQQAICDLFANSVAGVEKSIAIHPKGVDWKFDPSLILAHAIKFALITMNRIDPASSVFKAIDTRVRSDMYGSPLASTELAVTEAVIAASLANPVLSKAWSTMQDKKFLEQLSLSSHRRLARMALRGYLAQVGTSAAPTIQSESEEAWLIRLLWIEQLSKQTRTNLQAAAWLMDCWEVLLDRARKDSIKSPFMSLFNKKAVCDKLWKYLTHEAMLLPLCVRSPVVQAVHALYLQVYGTGIPGPYKELVDEVRPDGKGPLSFWLPMKDHERVYRRFVYRGTNVKPEPPKAPAPKKPKLLITSAGSVPLAS